MPSAHQSSREWWRAPYQDSADFGTPPPSLSPEERTGLRERLEQIYGADFPAGVLVELERLIRVHHAHRPPDHPSPGRAARNFSHRDLILITYGDMVRSQNLTGLAALNEFLARFRRGEPVFSILHILPFFPSSSDRGFSVTDFRAVDSNLGTWTDIRRLGETYRLLFDGVLNHASAQSHAFQEMLAGNPRYRDFAVTFRSPDEITPEQRAVLRRPRTSDILTRFETLDGPRWVWTTFSPDQIDLNYRNPAVLLAAIDTLLYYVRQGADLIRLDAVTYLWKQLGTSSASLEQTHAIVKLFRAVLDLAAPEVALVTESNVPHAENVSYFGNGEDEAQLVYNFALPPLVLHAFYRGDATWLTRWAAQLEYPRSAATFLNMLDTHDGIGLLGAQDFLPPEEMEFLVTTARQHGALISRRSSANGDVPYEINTTWYSALNLENTEEPRALQVQRFMASRSIALALRGVPAIYLHSLVGTRNDFNLAMQSNVKRDVNRGTLDMEILARNLAEPRSKLQLLAEQYRLMLRARQRNTAFHPGGRQEILNLHPALFALLRVGVSGDSHALCLTNVSGESVRVQVPTRTLCCDAASWLDIIRGRGWQAREGVLVLTLNPYDYLWLSPFPEVEKQMERPG
ncbi:MAG: alpha-amylase family glycosyl hydrolase [Bryobacter sp.]|nr:alpha-amylase family glycosyl hydrolase [Bryobacter sp.]